MESFLMGTYSPPPPVFVRGAGSELFDEAGHRYLDFIGGLAVTALGHAHPVVASAIGDQAATLSHVSNLYKNALAPQVAQTIDRLVGAGRPAGGQVFFCNSGAEANECAIKLARKWARDGRHKVVATHGSFHGRTLSTLAATGQPAKHEPFLPMPEGFTHVAYDDLGAMGSALSDESVAAVLIEPIQGEGGVIEPSSDYLAGLRTMCDDHHVLLIADEIQTGLGRTGTWFAFQAQNLVPDIVTMAKALGNGMPVGACWAKAEVAAAFAPGDHATTFGGQPLALSAVRATLEVMEAQDVCGRARRSGAILKSALQGLPGVVAVEGRGLLLAMRLERPEAARVAGDALVAGLLVNAVRPDSIRLAPSLLVTKSEIEEAVTVLGEVLGGPGGAGEP
ncbi:MAG: acetylornithine transaminase [Acidimicrobiales bacterium]